MVCQVVSFSVCFAVLSRNIPLKMNLVKYVVKPLIAGGLMAFVAYFGYMGISGVVHSNIIALPVSIAVAAVCYFVLVFKLRILSEEEIKMLPAGVKLYGLLTKIKFI